MKREEAIKELNTIYLATEIQRVPVVKEDVQEALKIAIECIEIVNRLENLIPKDTPYCYTSLGWNAYENCHKINPCPYWDIETVNDPQYGEREIEWCHYLGEELSIQDQVKDCGISYGL